MAQTGNHTPVRDKNWVDRAIRVVVQRHPYHPIRDYLESLVWDGKGRMRTVLHHFLGVEENDLTYECLKLFMLGAVERVYHPGCKFEIMLCLVGEQGLGTSNKQRFLPLDRTGRISVRSMTS